MDDWESGHRQYSAGSKHGDPDITRESYTAYGKSHGYGYGYGSGKKQASHGQKSSSSQTEDTKDQSTSNSNRATRHSDRASIFVKFERMFEKKKRSR